MAQVLTGKYGTVRFNDRSAVTDEKKSLSGKVTAYPIEQNAKINDHFEKDSNKGSIQGVLVDGGAAIATLEKMFNKADILTYTGSYRMDNIILTQLDFSTNSAIKNGFYFTATYERINIVGAQYAPLGAKSMSDQDAGKSTATKSSAKPAQDGLQTKTAEKVSSSAYSDYVNTFNNKQTPSTAPLSRATPTYNGYE